MKSFLLAALLLSAIGQVSAQIQDAASDRIVVVGNPSQPVVWNHRGNIQDAINKAQPNGTVVIPTSYTGTECNPISSCNPGNVAIIDWRNASSLDSPGPIGDVTPNSVAATTLSSTQGAQSLPPAQPSLDIPPDLTGTCDYPSAYLLASTVQICNLNGILVLNNGSGNYELLPLRIPVQAPADGVPVAWNQGNSDFEVSSPNVMILNAMQLNTATPTGSGSKVSFGTTAGFGNGSSGTSVTTTTKNTGSGPATPQTIVKYLQVDIGGTKYWIPLTQ